MNYTTKQLEEFKQKGVREFTASEITKQAMKLLDLAGIECWRSNNIPVKGRTFIGRKGVSDIMGFVRSSGQLVACEVKKIGDTVKKDQEEFLGQVKKSGAWP